MGNMPRSPFPLTYVESITALARFGRVIEGDHNDNQTGAKVDHDYTQPHPKGELKLNTNYRYQESHH